MKGFTKKELKDRISNMTWSFSRLNGFSTCKRMWFLTYVLTQDEMIEIAKSVGLLAVSK